MRTIYKFTGLSPLLGLAIALTLMRSVPSFAQDATAIVGNHPASAETEVPVGAPAAAVQLMMAVTLQLRDRAGADKLLAQLQDPQSANYRHWLTSAEFAARFDPTQADVDAVVDWLSSEGFTILSSSRHERLVRFAGTVAQAQQAFHTTIYNFGAGNAYGNVDDPLIPARFAGVIAQVHGLDNMRAAKATSRFIPRFSKTPANAKPGHASRSLKIYASLNRAASANDAAPTGASPDAKIGSSESFGPADFRTFYNETPLVNVGINGGGGDCIAIVGDSDFEQSAVDTFNSSFGEAASNITKVVVNGSDPGFNTDEEEALLDLEWSHAVAPGAATRFYVGDSAVPVIAPVVDEINAAVNDNQCGAISVSFSLCGGSSSFFTNTVSPIYVKATLQGQSIFISEGDDGAAGLVYNSTFGCIPASTQNVNELSTDPNVTAVGGASFDPIFDGAGNDTSVVTSTALRVWNEPNDGISSGGASGGGASAYYTKPSYQSGLGVPADNQRDVPDVSLIASPYFPGVFTYMDGNCFITTCNGAGSPTAEIFGGTSLSAPAWAGIAKLVAQQNNVTRLGSLNTTIYQLANSTSYATIFQDVTAGNNNFNGVTGYAAGPGFDLATGWGTVDINALATLYLASVTPTPTPTATPTPGPAALTLSPKTLAFGNIDFAVAGSASKVKKLTITNPAKYKAAAVISAIVGSAGFTADPACNNATIASGKKLVCNITYRPTALGAVSRGSLIITDNAGGSPHSVKLTGAGIQGKLTVTPGSLNFTKVPVSTTSAPKMVKLDNDTVSTFTISSITTGNPAFVASQNCVGTLGAIDCSISVTYTPSATTKLTDTLTITDVPDGIIKAVKLTGTGK